MPPPRQDVAWAAGWSLLAAVALAAHVLLAPVVAGPQVYELLAVLGFGLLTPAIALLHARFAGAAYAASLATLAGLATAVTGAAALLLNDLEPAALFFLGTWWWVAGRLAVRTGALPRALGIATAAAAIFVFAAMLADILGLGRWAWQAPRLMLAAWLVALAFVWYREREVG